MDGLDVSYGGPSQLTAQASAGSTSLEEVWAWWGLPRQWNGLWFIWLLHANILLFDVCRIASDSWAYWVHSCNDSFLKSLNSSGSHSDIYHVYARIRLIFWCFGCSCLQATGEDFNVEEGEGKQPLGLFLMWVWSGLNWKQSFWCPGGTFPLLFFVHILIARFTSVRICSLFGILSSPVLVQWSYICIIIWTVLMCIFVNFPNSSLFALECTL